MDLKINWTDIKSVSES